MIWGTIRCFDGHVLSLFLSLSLFVAPVHAGVRKDLPSPTNEEATELRQNAKRFQLDQGNFNRLTIGDTKEQALIDLRAMGVRSIYPELLSVFEVNRASDLDKLRSAEGLIIGGGDLRVGFQGDQVQFIAIAPVFAHWQHVLDGAQTRDDVFAGLANILIGSPGVSVRSYAPDARRIKLLTLGPQDMDLLNKYHRWRVSYHNEEGFWSIKLTFAEDRLSEILVMHSPTELP